MNKYEGAKILVVDDEHANIFFLEGLLTEEKFNVQTATNGFEALKIMSGMLPDLVLLDLMMPEMSGFEVLDKMMVDPVLKNIPVIMVTAKTEPEDVELALQKGAIDYIKKPFDDLELLARIGTSLRIKRNEDSLRENARSKEEFIKIISHDLRTPFASISGFADILLQDENLENKLSEDHRESLEIIVSTTNHLIDYFNRLLDWSKLETSKLKLVSSRENLKRIINTSWILFKSKLEEKNIKFESKVSENVELQVDKVFFNQVVNNLLSNAIKFTPKGGKISVYTQLVDKVVSLHIKDSGTGILDIAKSDLFDSKKHFTTRGTEGEKGSGVGLKICKKIIDAHGFSIDYISEQNQGTEFIISMNLDD